MIKIIYNEKIEKINKVFFRLTQYDAPIVYGYHSSRLNYEKDKNKMIRSDKSLYRTRNKLKNLIDSNITRYSKFVSMTFKDDIKDREEALKKFHNFKINFKRVYKEDIKYVGVMELQNGSERHGKTPDEARKVWHFHIILFHDFKINFEEFNKKVWKYGITETKCIDSVLNLGKYLIKYITKDNEDLETNKKSILRSKNLKTPQVEYSLRNTSYQDNYLVKGFQPSFIYNYKIEIPQRVNKATGEIIPSRTINAIMTEFTKYKKIPK